jgi:hypothetical protein
MGHNDAAAFGFDTRRLCCVFLMSQAAGNKNGNALSEEDVSRITRSEDRAERAILQSMITHADDIKLVRDTAKRMGVDVEEAAEDEFVKSKLERTQASQTTKENTPAPRIAAVHVPLTEEEFLFI